MRTHTLSLYMIQIKHVLSSFYFYVPGAHRFELVGGAQLLTWLTLGTAPLAHWRRFCLFLSSCGRGLPHALTTNTVRVKTANEAFSETCLNIEFRTFSNKRDRFNIWATSFFPGPVRSFRPVDY